MDTAIPSTSEVQAALKALGHADVQALSSMSGVPFTTLWKVRAGETLNPGIETVRKFWPHIDEARRPTPAEPATAAQEAAHAG